MKIETFRNKKGEYCWRLKHANGKIIVRSSEGYKKRSDRDNSINITIRDIGNAQILEAPGQ
jgi:uncharacterized protein YegP (UPF0339 family)